MFRTMTTSTVEGTPKKMTRHHIQMVLSWNYDVTSHVEQCAELAEKFVRQLKLAAHLSMAARCRHESISFVDESSDMTNAFGSLDRKKHGRRDSTKIARRKCWLQTELRVVLRKSVFFMGDKNAPDEFGAVFQGAIDTWQTSVTKKNGGIFKRNLYEDIERSCGVALCF